MEVVRMRKQFGALKVGDWFWEIDKEDGKSAFTFPLQKLSPEQRTDPHDGSKYTVNAGAGKLRTYFHDDEEVELVSGS